MTNLINSPLCTFVLILAACNASASTYYVSDSTGDDRRSPAQAQNPNTPWKTIQKAASAMASGDICYIRAGTYRETVAPKAGQTFAGYEGEYVLISGCDAVSPGAWTEHSGDIHKAGVATKVYDVFVDGSYMDKAQYPSSNGDRNSQAAWAPTAASFVNRATTRITFDDGMNFPDGYWDGGWYQGLNGENCYSGTCGNITSSSSGVLTLGDVEFRQEYENPAHFGTGKGYIINHLNCLDTPKEWHWEDDTLYLYPPSARNPSDKAVEARVRIYGFDVEVDNVTIKGLHFKGAAVRLAGNGCTVEGCTFRYVSPWGNHRYPGQSTAAGYYNFGGTADGTSGIHISGTENTFKNNYVAHGWGALVSCRGSNNWIDNNFIDDANWATRQNTVNIQVSGASQKITRNTLRKSNAMLMCISDMEDNQIHKTTVLSNDCRYWGYLNPDGGTAAIATEAMTRRATFTPTT